MKNKISVAVSALAVFYMTGTALSDDSVYLKFPITVKGWTGSETNSVSYTGQIARHTLHDSLKKLAGNGNGSPNPNLKANMMVYYEGKNKGRKIIAPKTKGLFIVEQTIVDQISSKKNLAGKTYKGVVNGMPNNMTGRELVTFWIDKASSAEKGVDLVNGYNYPQLISKFIMGAVFYNQVVDNYLDEKLSAEKKPNDKPYKKGARYTGKEHSWDEAFGYFGAPAHTLKLTPKQVYEIAKQGKKSKNPEDALMYADYNKDGRVDLKTEMTFGPAYYAAAFDKSGTGYLHAITNAFLDGRKLLVKADGVKLSDGQRRDLRNYAAIVSGNWERVLAEAVFKYAGSTYKDLVKINTIVEAKGDPAKAYSKYLKHWGELKGFSLAIQTGKNNLGETATRLNRLIGSGPLLIDQSQVVDIDSKGNYIRDQGIKTGEYMLHMLKVQKLMVDRFKIKARKNDMQKEMSSLTGKLGDSSSSEND